MRMAAFPVAKVAKTLGKRQLTLCAHRLRPISWRDWLQDGETVAPTKTVAAHSHLTGAFYRQEDQSV